MCVPFCLPNNIALEFILAARATFSTIVSPRNPKQYWVFYGAPTIKMLPKKKRKPKTSWREKSWERYSRSCQFYFFFFEPKILKSRLVLGLPFVHLRFFLFFFFFDLFSSISMLVRSLSTAGIKCRSSGAAIFQWVYAFFYRKNCAIRSVWIEKKKHLTKHVSPYLFICLSMRLMSRAKRSQKHPIPMSPALA